jgi:hypothetical protein
MIQKSYLVKSKGLSNRLTTLIQHKLRNVVKCYSVGDFNLDIEAHTFTFHKIIRVNKTNINGEKVFSGFYTLSNIDDEQCQITIAVQI